MNTAITIRQLRYLVAVADTLHFGRAAELCSISQPTLSAQIKQLEDLLGIQLVERTKRRVLLTPSGIEAAAKARQITGLMSELIKGAKRQNGDLDGQIRVGVIPTIGPYLLPRILPQLRKDYPSLQLFLREDRTERLLAKLKTGELDVLVLALPVDEWGIETEALYDEPFLLALPSGHPLCNEDSVVQDDLKGERLLLLEEGHCLRDQALSVCSHVEALDREVFAATSLDTLREMVASRIGITLLPALACTGAVQPGDQVELRPFRDPAPSRRVGLVWRKGTAHASAFNLLAAFLRDHLPAGALAIDSKD